MNRAASLPPMPAQAHVKTQIATLIARKDIPGLKKFLEPWLPMDLAPLLAELSVEELATLFRAGSRDLDAAIFTYLPLESQKKLLRVLTPEQMASLLNALPPDDRTAFLNEQPLDVAMQLLSMLSADEREVAQSLLAYPEHSVGRMMTLDFVAVHPEWSVRQVLDYIREHGYDRETLNMVYVVDDGGHLIDDVRVRRFLLAPLDSPVRALMDGNYSVLKATDDREHALDLFRKFDRVALPVTDEANKLIGIVTVDDILDVAEEEATEDIQKLGGSEALDEPYTTIALSRMVKKRASWLVVLFLGEMLTATAMGFFEDEIKKAVVLALFVPLIISSGGNAGSQAATLVIRALALGEFKLRDWWRVMRREFAAGLALGVILGIIGFLRIAAWSMFSNIYGDHWVLVALTVGVSLVGIVLWGSLMGSMLPLVLKRLGVDPATSSAPFVATLVDVTGLIIYFTVAFIIMLGSLPSEEQTIRDLDARFGASAEKRDLEGQVAAYAPDAVMVLPTQPVLRGIDEIRANAADFLKTPGFALAVVPEKIEIADGGDIATDTGRREIGLDTPQGHVKSESRYLQIWRKIDGKWKVTYDIVFP